MSRQSTTGRPPAADCNLLWALSGNVCAEPSCESRLVDFSSSHGVTQGEIAHIHASGGGGPRFSAELPQGQRDSYENTLLLCRYHHRQIDGAPEQYPPPLLREWKQNHEMQFQTDLVATASEQGLLEPPTLPNTFVGRQKLVDHVEDCLINGVVLSGLAGSGKTLVAADVMEQTSKYHYRFWLRGSSKTTLENDLHSVGVYLALVGTESPTSRAAEVVLTNLQTRSECLLVIDDLADDALLWLPAMGIRGNVLVTTQAASLPGLYSIAVPAMSEAEADALLCTSPRLRQAPAERRQEIAALCAYLPLAVAQVAAFSEASGIGADEHLALLRQRRVELLERGDTPHATLASSMQLVWERLSPNARELGGVLAQLADSPLPISSEGFQPENPVAVLSDVLAFEDAVTWLRRYSLVERSDGLVQMHSLVRDLIRTRLECDDTKVLLLGGAAFVGALLPYWSGRPDTWAVMERLEAHIVWLSAYLVDSSPVFAASLANKLGPYLESRGRLIEARAVLERGLEESRKSDDLGLRGSLSQNLANVYADMGLPERALSLMQEAARLKAQGCGEDHALTAVGYAGVANILETLGRVEEAIDWYERALAIYVRGGDPAPIAETKIDIAGLHVSSNFARANQLLGEARVELSACADVWHLQHALHMTAGALSEAEGNLPLAAREAALGVRVARTAGPLSKELAQSLALHGRLLLHIGVVDSGVRLLEKSIKIYEDVGTSSSADAARTRGNLGYWLVLSQVDVVRGEALLRGSLEALRKVLPHESGTVLRARLMWAEALPDLGEFDRAGREARLVEQAATTEEVRLGARSLIERLSGLV